MEAYEFETTQIVNRFLRHRIELPECITELDAALARFTPRMTNEQVGRLRIIVLANNEIVMKEMERRSADRLLSTLINPRRLPLNANLSGPEGTDTAPWRS